MCESLKRNSAHSFKESSCLRVSFQNLMIHISKFSRSGNIHRQHVLFLMPVIFIVPFYDTVIRHFIELLLKLFLCIFGTKSRNLIKCLGVAFFHFQCYLALFICNQIVKSPVFRTFFCNFLNAKFNVFSVSYNLRKPCKRFTERRI